MIILSDSRLEKSSAHEHMSKDGFRFAVIGGTLTKGDREICSDGARYICGTDVFAGYLTLITCRILDDDRLHSSIRPRLR